MSEIPTSRSPSDLAVSLAINSFALTVPAISPMKFSVPVSLALFEPGDTRDRNAVMERFGASSAMPPPLPHQGIFDTGATRSVISVPLAEKLRLPVLNRSMATSASDTIEVTEHYVNILLPNRVTIPMCRVFAMPLAMCDFLIGMDIISKGDTSIVSRQGFMALTFTMYFRKGRIIRPPSQPPSSA